MSLNWAEGLKGGAQGLALMQRSSQQKTDILYKQVSEANMMRFRKEESATDREFRASEGALNRESQDKQREATNALTKSNQDATSEYRKATTKQAGDRLEETSRHNRATEDTQKLESIRRRQDSYIEAGEKEIEALGIVPDTAKVAEINARVARKVARAELDNKGAVAFDQAHKTLQYGDPQAAQELALRYGKMTPEERKAVKAEAKENVKGGMSEGQALARAIGQGGVDLNDPSGAVSNDFIGGVTETPKVEVGPDNQRTPPPNQPYPLPTGEGLVPSANGPPAGPPAAENAELAPSQIAEQPVELSQSDVKFLKQWANNTADEKAPDFVSKRLFGAMPTSGVLKATLEKYGIVGEQADKALMLYARWKTDNKRPPYSGDGSEFINRG